MFGLIGSAIGAVGSLIGAKKQQKAAEADRDYQNWYNDPAQVRQRAEAAGFNPLALIGPYQSASAQAGYTGIGSGIANAALLASDALTKHGDKIGKVAELEQQNEKLQKQLEKNTIRPQVGGVYGGGVVPHASSLLGLSPLASVGPVRPKRAPWAINSEADFPITTMTGSVSYVPNGIAKRLNLNPYDTWIAEDNEAIIGDNFATDTLNIAGMPDALIHLNKGIGPSISDRQQLLRDSPRFDNVLPRDSVGRLRDYYSGKNKSLGGSYLRGFSK